MEEPHPTLADRLPSGTMVGRQLLLVEDEYLIATEVERALGEAGASVIGPIPKLGWALELVEQSPVIDGAVLDINLQGELAYPLIDMLMARDIPVVLLTGYNSSRLPDRYRHLRICIKPINPRSILARLSDALSVVNKS